MPSVYQFLINHGCLLCGYKLPCDKLAVFYFINLGGVNETKKVVAVQIKLKEIKMNKKGFTLLELLVVVLIIGILASIALPQYKMAVTKAKVASILPLMRRFKDAMEEYKLQHGSYDDEEGLSPDAATLGANWPSDWKDSQNDKPCGDSTYCYNDYWECYASSGIVKCIHYGIYDIGLFSPDDEDFHGKTMCMARGDEGHKICKALGGKAFDDEGYDAWYILY